MVQADEDQKTALQRMQNAVVNASGSLDSNCTKNIPAVLSDKLNALRQGLEAFTAVLDAVRPAVEKFYATLNDEQKASLVATYLATGYAKDNSDQTRRLSRNTYRVSSTMQSEGTCQAWAGALREWPIRQIESTLMLSDIQHAALYDLTASIYRATVALVTSCPTEVSFTPLGQIEAKRKRVNALAQAISAIHPALDRFADTLDDKQKTDLTKIVNSTQVTLPRRRSGDGD
jgi:hypothetical protein